MNHFKGYIDKIVYRSEDTGYSVLSAVMDGHEYTLVGVFPSIEPGETIEAEGHESSHPLYGEQFSVERYHSIVPQSTEAIERYLGSGAIKGIGAALASRIVKRFKADTMRIIEEEPERLAEIKGISERMAIEIAAAVEGKKELQNAMIFLQEYGIGNTLAGKIFARYGTGMYEVLRENPYRLAEDIDGVGFKTCDEIARRAGILSDAAFRISAGIQYALSMAQSNGHTYLPREELEASASALLAVPLSDLENQLVDLQINEKIVVKDGRVYLASMYRMELRTAAMLTALNLSAGAPDAALFEEIALVTGEEGIELDALQRKAVEYAAKSGLLVITGGPGTGKTTTINTIIRLFERQGKEIMLAAPTGRAAKRMTEASKCEAKTIHRLLEYQGKPGEDSERAGTRFDRNAQNPLEADVVIIDEMSMVDIFLMHALLKAIAPGTRLILVGDANQLPSVGAGNVLRDIISSGVIPVVQLTHIFRQAATSDIIVNAHRINDGLSVDLGKASKDFLFIRSGTPEQIFHAVRVLLTEKLPKYLDVDPMELQVMTPQKKGVLGVERLNQVLQDVLNPQDGSKPEKELYGTRFRLGDKVMQMKNDYTLGWELRGAYGIPEEKGEGVFNGDTGIVEEINLFAQTLTVRFDDRYVTYEFKQCENLELAYAITIHKSQGSEYPAVIMPMYRGPQMLMNRNLLYTGVTRARRCVCLVGDPQVFEQMLRNETEAKRYSSLAERLKEASAGFAIE